MMDKNETTESQTKSSDSEDHIEILVPDEFKMKQRRCDYCNLSRIYVILRILLLIGILAGFLVLICAYLTSDAVEDETTEAFLWLQQMPTWISALTMILLYMVSLAFFCPGTPFNLASGFLFGFALGATVAIIGCISGAILAFVLGRTIARDWVKTKVENNSKFRVIDWAIQKNGLYIVTLTRLSPLFPFPLLNYMFGATRIKVWQYVVGTLVGIAPGTIAYSYLGTLMRDLADIWSEGGETEDSHKILWWIFGIIVTLVSTVVISLITHRAISNATKNYEQNQELLSMGMTEIPPDDNVVELEPV